MYINSYLRKGTYIDIGANFFKFTLFFHRIQCFNRQYKSPKLKVFRTFMLKKCIIETPKRFMCKLSLTLISYLKANKHNVVKHVNESNMGTTHVFLCQIHNLVFLVDNLVCILSITQNQPVFFL